MSPPETLGRKLVRLRRPLLMMLPGMAIGLSLLYLMIRTWPTEMGALLIGILVVGSGILFFHGLDRTVHDWDE